MSLDPQAKVRLLSWARKSVASAVETGSAPSVDIARESCMAICDPGASFVTLRHRDALRGCIGTLEPHRALLIDVVENAVASALRDPRFDPVREEELPQLSLHISVLGPSEPMEFADTKALLDQLRPGVDGLILQQGARRATFLPAVWESLPRPEEFFAALLGKARIGTIEPGKLMAWRYQTESFAED
jgi:AmmeMemoRadiSam system protein A